MMKQKIYGILIVVLFVIISLLAYLNQSAIPPAETPAPLPENEPIIAQEINSFEECAAATNLVFTTYPVKCLAPDGQVFVNPPVYQEKVIVEVEKVK